MWTKMFGSVDFGKLTIDSISGLISSIALLFMVDALTPGHLTQNLVSDKPAGTIVVEALIVIVGSAIFGLLMDSIFHTFGRWVARKIWKPLQNTLDYRNCLMENLGLSKVEFEWVQSKDENAPNEVETKYMRYTEVAGSSAYATMLLAIALAFFLRFEYHATIWECFLVTGIFTIVALILLITSAASLEKYEMNKTSSAMDEIRSMSSDNLAFEEMIDRKRALKLFVPGILWRLALFVGAIFILPSLCLAVPTFSNHFANTGNDFVISSLNSDNTVVALELKVTGGKTTLPVTTMNNMVIPLTGTVKNPKLVPSGKATSLALVGENKDKSLPWNLVISLSNLIESNNSILLSAEFSSDVPVTPGVWRFPVMISHDGQETMYLLAYVLVTITPDTVTKDTTSFKDDKITIINSGNTTETTTFTTTSENTTTR